MDRTSVVSVPERFAAARVLAGVRHVVEWLIAPTGVPRMFNLRTADIAVLVFSLAMFAIVSGAYLEIPGAPVYLAWFCGLFIWILVVRYIHGRYDMRWLNFFACWAPAAGVLVVYFGLPPIVELVSPRVKDALMVAFDDRLFGVQLSVAVQGTAPPLVNDYLAVSYLSYFWWGPSLAFWLWFRERYEDFDTTASVLVTTIFVNYLFYIAVPVMGPRYYLSDQFTTGIEGWCCAEQINAAFMRNPMVFDCFPSGHTGTSLTALFLAWRFGRRYFWVMLPFAIGLIVATIFLRFHYVADLLAAVPIYFGVIWIVLYLEKRYPHGWVIERRDAAPAAPA